MVVPQLQIADRHPTKETGSLRRGDTTFEIAFDLVDHELVVQQLRSSTASDLEQPAAGT